MKNYVIIGGTSGIGKGIAEKLLAKGHKVITVSRRESSETGGRNPPSEDSG
jgi:NAD(P)-dependent dehydrogenase (short-subunit alcohol dehydrogenase family)